MLINVEHDEEIATFKVQQFAKLYESTKNNFDLTEPFYFTYNHNDKLATIKNDEGLEVCADRFNDRSEIDLKVKMKKKETLHI